MGDWLSQLYLYHISFYFPLGFSIVLYRNTYRIVLGCIGMDYFNSLFVCIDISQHSQSRAEQIENITLHHRINHSVTTAC